MTETEVQQYIDAGWAVVPIVAGRKRAASDWSSRTYSPSDFSATDGVAGKCGEPSGWRVDVDCDAAEAVAAARMLLPLTGLIHGRSGKPTSHYWYLCRGIKTYAWTDVKSAGGQSEMLIEIRSTGGYTVLPPSVWTDKKDGHTEVVTWESHREAMELDEPELVTAVRNVAIASLLARHWPGPGARHHLIGPLAGLLCQAGMDSTHVVEVIRAAATVAGDGDLNDRVVFAQNTVAKFRKGEKVTGGPSLKDHLSDAVIAKLRSWLRLADADALEEMNAKHFVVRLGKDEVIATEDGAEVFFQHRRALDLRYANKTVQTGVDKKSGEPLFESLFPAWLSWPQRRDHRTVTFAPPPRVVDPRDYNLWKGFAVQPRPGDCSRFLDHLLQVVCAGSQDHFDYLLNLLALTVQEPGVPSEVAVVLKGDQGTGKGIFIRTIGELFGPHFAHLDNTQDMTGFNALLSGKVVVFADEAFWAGDKQHQGTLKRITTEPTIRITRKGIDSTIEPNCLHLFIASNEDWVYSVAERDRRVFFLEVAGHRQGDYEYFGALTAELNSGGREALLDLLLKFPVDRDLIRRIPKTAGLRTQQDKSLRGEMMWWQECLHDERIGTFGWPEWLPAVEFFNVYKSWCQDRNQRIMGSIDFGRKLRDFLTSDKPKMRRVNGEPTRTLQLRSIQDARNYFDKWLGTPGDWPEIRNSATPPTIPF